jgi:DNA repair exonuclease SbcCD ATPase subunit
MNFGVIIGRGKQSDKGSQDTGENAADAVDEGAAASADVPVEEPWPSIDLTLTDLEFGDDADQVETKSIEEKATESGADSAVNLTSHTRNRLTALNTFEKIYGNADGYLHEINSKLVAIRTLHGSVGELINILHSEIHRANELELANATLLAEHRNVWEQLQDSNRKHQEREQTLERLQQRETMLVQDAEALRAALSTAKLELVEASNARSTHETQLGELTKTLSARTIEGERRARENEALREKNVNLSIELDKATKREAESRHKLEELSRSYANETARSSEVRATLSKNENEILRLQKALDHALSRQAEMQQSADVLEADRQAEVQRSAAEFRGLRSEIQSLQSRLEVALSENSAVVGEIAELRMQLRDLAAEKQVADERLSALIRESESDKRDLATANANLAELTLRQTSEQIQLDVRIQECEDLRAEIVALNAQIRELLPYERLHRVTQARQKEADSSVVDFTNAAVDTKRGRPAGPRRRQAV